MPELPEVEVVRRDLEREVVGKKIKNVEADGMRAVRRHHNRKQFANRLIGKKIVGVERRGKYLLCRLDGDDVLVIHLGMSGQLLRKKSAREPMAKHTHVVITFTQGGQLRFVDPRTFGEMFVTELDNVEKQVTELAHLGIDPLETAMSWEHFGSLLAQRHAKLKPLLMDQKFIAGIGNIYSDEILWGAGLRWDRMSDALTAQEVRRLYRAMMETLQEAVKHRGSSLADEQYVDLFGRPGEYQHFHNVYARGRGLPALPARGGARALRRTLHLLLRRVPGLVVEPDRTRKRVFVAGRVQGVWFRESCREQAVALGVTGWVRNLADGRVEVVLEGPEAAVERVVQWCHDGPAARTSTGSRCRSRTRSGSPASTSADPFSVC